MWAFRRLTSLLALPGTCPERLTLWCTTCPTRTLAASPIQRSGDCQNRSGSSERYAVIYKWCLAALHGTACHWYTLAPIGNHILNWKLIGHRLLQIWVCVCHSAWKILGRRGSPANRKTQSYSFSWAIVWFRTLWPIAMDIIRNPGYLNSLSKCCCSLTLTWADWKPFFCFVCLDLVESWLSNNLLFERFCYSCNMVVFLLHWDSLKSFPPVLQVIELPLTNPELFLRVGIIPPKGCLLYGPPGKQPLYCVNYLQPAIYHYLIVTLGRRERFHYNPVSFEELHVLKLEHYGSKHAITVLLLDFVENIYLIEWCTLWFHALQFYAILRLLSQFKS